MENRLNRVLIVIFFFGTVCFPGENYAVDEKLSLPLQEASPTPLPEKKPLSSSTLTVVKEAPFKKLNDIVDKIKLQKKEVEEKLNLLRKAKTEEEKNRIQAEIDEISQFIIEQEQSFEAIQTGSLELTKLEELSKAPFDWQKELLEILKPIMNELHQMTEDKRKLVNLQNRIPFLESQIRDINVRLEHMAQINKDGLGNEALERFEQINKKWQNLFEEKKHLLEVAQLQYNEIIKSQTAQELSLSDHIKQFATGRGATILFAIIAFMSVYFFAMLLWKGILWISHRRREDRQTNLQRVFMLVYYTATILFSVTAVFYVLNARNDQVLIGITVLLLIVLIWLLRNYIPHYIGELKTLLNAGTVREGERIIYNGIPMKVDNLNFYTKLTNSTLPKLTLRLPLSELSNYVSRPYRKDESWFPCQEGDFVMLSDGTYNMVQSITFENVIFSSPNGMLPQTYSISDFLAAKPKNFSHGFVVVSDFGLDYKYQQQCTKEIPELLCAGIKEGLQKESYGRFLKDIWVFFAQANTSSLDYKIVAVFDGQAAADYYSITRDLQRYAVEVCNQKHWEIPFTQLVVQGLSNKDCNLRRENEIE